MEKLRKGLGLCMSDHVPMKYTTAKKLREVNTIQENFFMDIMNEEEKREAWKGGYSKHFSFDYFRLNREGTVFLRSRNF